MIRVTLRKIHSGEGGFTLIEVIVVMSILGILAAIVSISLLGVTGSAHERGKQTEMKTVQTAWEAMLTDQQVATAALAAAGRLGVWSDKIASPNRPENAMNTRTHALALGFVVSAAALEACSGESESADEPIGF